MGGTVGANAGYMKIKWKILAFLVFLTVTFLVVLGALYAYILTYDYNRLKPEIISAVGDLTGRKLTIKGDIRVAVGLLPSLVIEDVTLQNAAWGSRSRMLQIKRFELQLSLLPLITGTIEIRKVFLFDSEIFLEMNRKGVLNLPVAEFGQSVAETSGGPLPYLPNIALKDVRIVNSRLLFKGSRMKSPVTLKLNQLVLKPSGSPGSFRLVVDAHYNRMPFTAKGSLGAIGPLLDPEKPWPFKVALSAAASKLEIEGSVKDLFGVKGFELDAAFESQDISKPALAAGIRLPVKNKVKITGHASGDLLDSIRFSKLKLYSGRNAIQGFVLLKLKGRKPYFNATLTSDRLDLREFTRGKSKPGKKAGSKPSRKFFPAKPFLNTRLLRKVNADVGVRIKQCLLARTAMRNLRLNLSLKNGRMTLKPISATIGSGKLRANVAIREVKKKLVGTVTLKIDNMDAGRMLKELDISDTLEGKFDVRVDLSGRGRSVADIMTGLNGYVSVIMGRGRFNNRLVRELGGDLSAGLFQLLSVGGKQGELTEINCFVTRFDIVDGFADARVLVLNTTALRVVGKGTVNLKTEKLDISLKPLPKIGLGTDSIGKISLSLGNLAKSFKLGGTLAAPELAIDPKHAAITIGKALGGFVLFGPFGLAALLVDGDSGKKGLCATAVAIAKQKKSLPLKKRPANSKKKRKKKQTPGTFLDGLKKSFKQRQIDPGDEQDN
jgi:uncharacterized protein involved in outer membrane biogenesis